jgi:hypothetical protein
MRLALNMDLPGVVAMVVAVVAAENSRQVALPNDAHGKDGTDASFADECVGESAGGGRVPVEGEAAAVRVRL